MIARAHHRLPARQEAIGPVKEVYRFTGARPREELQCPYPATSPLRRLHPEPHRGGSRPRRQQRIPSVPHYCAGFLERTGNAVILAKEPGHVENTAAIERQIESVFGLLGGLINFLRQDAT